MSLAPAKQDVRDRPALDGVTDPVDRDQKNADVDRKLRLYGIATALRESRLPTNDQIDSALEFALNRSPVATDELSESGKVLIQDTRQVLDTMRAIIREKNADELVQNFVWHTRQTDTDRAKKDPNEVLPVGQDKVQNDADVAAQHLRTLAALVITNGEARKLVADFGVIGRDLLARGAGQVAEMARPDEGALRRVDEPGPDHHFVTEGSRNASTNETPVIALYCLQQLSFADTFLRFQNFRSPVRAIVLRRTRATSSAKAPLSGLRTARSIVVTRLRALPTKGRKTLRGAPRLRLSPSARTSSRMSSRTKLTRRPRKAVFRVSYLLQR